MRPTVIALLLLVSGAAAAMAQPAKQNPSAQAPQKRHCDIGVVSHLGEKFNVWIQSSFEKPIYEEVPVESWHIDDLVVARIRGAVGKRAAVQRIPYRREVIARFEAPTFLGDQSGERLRTLATGWRCARYVVVTAGRVYDKSHDWVGLGIVATKFFVPRAFVHALILLRVYDGETFARLKAESAGPQRQVDESFWPDPPNSAAQNAKLREVTRELVARSLDTTLPKLPLTP